jgi:hypothetical protein
VGDEAPVILRRPVTRPHPEIDVGALGEGVTVKSAGKLVDQPELDPARNGRREEVLDALPLAAQERQPLAAGRAFDRTDGPDRMVAVVLDEAEPVPVLDVFRKRRAGGSGGEEGTVRTARVTRRGASPTTRCLR